MTRYGNETGSIGARSKRMTALRRPLLIGALTAGVITLGVSAAVAVGPLGSPSPEPSTPVGQRTSMMGGAGMMGEMGSSATMKAHMGSSMGSNMMGGAGMMGEMGSSGTKKAHMGSSTGPNMMGDKGPGARVMP
jgi:hypothetical protein